MTWQSDIDEISRGLIESPELVRQINEEIRKAREGKKGSDNELR
jgi:hypothetical protein